MQDYLPLITGSSGCLVALVIAVWAFATGKVHSNAEFSKLEAENTALRAENDRLREAVATERRTVNETAATGQVANQLITALVSVAAGKPVPVISAKPDPPGLTAKDLGL